MKAKGTKKKMKTELKAAGERLVNEYNRQVNLIDQQLRHQADLRLLGEAAIAASAGDDGLAKAQKQLAAISAATRSISGSLASSIFRERLQPSISGTGTFTIRGTRQSVFFQPTGRIPSR